MEGEFNNLECNNVATTFVASTNNTATSDELDAPLNYADKFGTKHSKKKKIVPLLVKTTGLTIILVAVGIQGVTFLRNNFVKDPPTIINKEYHVSPDYGFGFYFEIENSRNYSTYYFVEVNGVEVIKEDCSKPGGYEGNYPEVYMGDNLRFYISFTNKYDYVKVIEDFRTTVEGGKIYE